MSYLITFVLFVVLGTFSTGNASEKTRDEYLKLIQEYPQLITPKGNASIGEIEIITDCEKMRSIEKSTKRDVGLISKDQYWIWINDACKFPNGNEGVYGRVLWVKALKGTPGVVVMPILPDGRIVLNCNYRHATRSWEFELPRGVINPDEDVEAAAYREVLEETGMVIKDLRQLGQMTPDTGMTTSIIPVFVAHVVGRKETQQESSEAIEEIVALTIEEIKTAFLRGYHIWNIRGEKHAVPFRDPFLAFSLLLYELNLKKPVHHCLSGEKL